MTLRPKERPFRLGINYWPARTAMGWWPAFERGEVEVDFTRIATAGFDSVRLFLTWEDFQPRLGRVSAQMIQKLVTTLDVAAEAGLEIMPTLFTGHMSGANWIPSWALGGAEGDPRFRVVSDGRTAHTGIVNWYSDVRIARAQAHLASELSRALAGHTALWAWDLGNEGSNCVTPPTREHGRDWLRRIGDAIHVADASALVTIGLHMEDLESDRRMGPAEAAEVCSFLTMHGYPGYASWTRGPTDEAMLPFLAHITRWLGGGADVVFSELGLPTYRAGDAEGEAARERSASPLVEESEAAAYVGRSLAALRACGSRGAMLWCYADYVPSTWRSAPLDVAIHERTFGQWRADGSPKPAVETVTAFAQRRVAAAAPDEDTSWVDLEPGDFYESAALALPRLYKRYLEARGDRAPASASPASATGPVG